MLSPTLLWAPVTPGHRPCASGGLTWRTSSSGSQCPILLVCTPSCHHHVVSSWLLNMEYSQGDRMSHLSFIYKMSVRSLLFTSLTPSIPLFL